MTNKMQTLSFLQQQISIPAKQLIEPAPSASQLEQILQAGMSAPDHGTLRPFRFLIIQGEARQALSQVFADATLKRDPQVDEETLLKQQSKPLRSPMIIVVIARLSDTPKIPHIEQILSAGSAAQHIQLACRSLGFGSIWLTGDNCYDMTVNEALGVDLQERIVGFLYVGTPGPDAITTKARAAASTITEHWEKPQHTDFAI